MLSCLAVAVAVAVALGVRDGVVVLFSCFCSSCSVLVSCFLFLA